MQHLPLAVRHHGIFVALTKETDVVRGLEILDFAGIMSEFAVITPNRAHVLLTAMDHLLFAVTLYLSSDCLPSGHECDGENRKHEQDHEQHIALFRFAAARHLSPA